MAETATALPVQPVEAAPWWPMLTPIARDAISFSTASLLFLVIYGVSAFVVPRLVSVETYGVFKLFLLYGGYVGILHFGSLDGALVRWAKEPSTLVRREFPAVLMTAVVSSGAAVALASAVWIFVAPARGLWIVAVALVLYTLATNAITTVQFSMQAERRFRELSALSVLQPALFLAVLLISNATGRVTEQRLLGAYITSTVLTLTVYFVKTRGNVDWRSPSVSDAARLSRVHYRSGVFILLSNLGLNLVLGLDRLFLSTRFSLRDFAIYSFAASIFYGVCLMIQAVSKVVFPYVSQQTYSPEQRSSLLRAQRAVLAVWAVGLTAYFPADWLIREFLPAYVGAIPVLRIVLLGIGAVAVTQIVHSNYFRAFGQERRMFVGTCVGVSSFGLSLWLASSFHSLLAIACAAVTAHTIWWAANESLLWAGTDRTVGSTLRDFATMLSVAALFLYCSERPTVFRAALYLASATLGTTLVLGPRTILTVVERYVFAGEANS